MVVVNVMTGNNLLSFFLVPISLICLRVAGKCLHSQFTDHMFKCMSVSVHGLPSGHLLVLITGPPRYGITHFTRKRFKITRTLRRTLG